MSMKYKINENYDCSRWFVMQQPISNVGCQARRWPDKVFQTSYCGISKGIISCWHQLCCVYAVYRAFSGHQVVGHNNKYDNYCPLCSVHPWYEENSFYTSFSLVFKVLVLLRNLITASEGIVFVESIFWSSLSAANVTNTNSIARMTQSSSSHCCRAVYGA